jgi:hypothetical protein
VLAGAEERFAMCGDPQGVALDPAQHGLRQHHVPADGLRDLAELEGDPAHGIQPDLDHVPAIHVELVAELAQARVHRLRRVDRQTGDLHVERGAVFRGRGHHDHVPADRVVDQEDAKLEAGQRRSGAVRQIDQRRCG